MTKLLINIPRSLVRLEISAYSYAMFSFLLFFLRPYPQAFVGAMAMRIIDMLILCLPLIYFMISNPKVKLDGRISLIFFIFFLIFTFGLLSLSIGYFLNLTPLSFRDPLDVIRYLQIPVFLFFGYYLSVNNRFNIKHLFYITIIVIISITGLAVLQKLFPSQVNFLTKLYSPEHQSEKLFTTERVTSIFGNPNTTALMTCLFLCFLLSAVITKGIMNKSATYFCIALGVITILLSGSRTGFLAFAFLLLVYVFVRTKHKLIVIFISTGVLFLIFLFRNEILDIIKYFNYYLYLGMTMILNMDIDALFSEGNTFSRRFATWANALNLFGHSPVFGVGPLRGVVTSSTDNFYMYLLLRNGLVGLALYFTFVIYSLRIAFRIRSSRDRNSPVTLLANTYIFQTFVILFMNFLIEAQIQNSVIYLHLTTLGVLIGLSKQTIFNLNDAKKA